MERLGAVLHRLVSTEVITVAEADLLWDAALGDIRSAEVVSQGTSASAHGPRLSGAPGVSAP